MDGFDLDALRQQVDGNENEAITEFIVGICRSAALIEQPGAKLAGVNINELFASRERFEAAFDRLRETEPDVVQRAQAFLHFAERPAEDENQE